AQTMGIDRPLKALVWQAAGGKVWLSYNEPSWLATRHGLAGATKATVDAMAGGLRALATSAAGKQGRGASGVPGSQEKRLISTPSHTSPGWHDAILLLGRILIGGIFVQSGFGKLMGLDAFATGLAGRGRSAALVPVLASIGASVEFFGGLAIVFGVMTRCAALVMIAF